MANKGTIPWNKGKQYTTAQRAAMNTAGLALGRRGKDSTGYHAVHWYVRKTRGKATHCEECGFYGRCQWANISGEYRRDPADYKSLCVPCHQKFDGVTLVPRQGSISLTKGVKRGL